MTAVGQPIPLDCAEMVERHQRLGSAVLVRAFQDYQEWRKWGTCPHRVFREHCLCGYYDMPDSQADCLALAAEIRTFLTSPSIWHTLADREPDECARVLDQLDATPPRSIRRRRVPHG